MDWEKLVKQLRIQNWIILMILGATSFFVMSSDFTLGIILGGLIIIANFNILQHTIRRAFSPDGVMKNNKLAIVAKYYFRLAILGIIIYILITNGWVNPIGLAMGLSIVVFSIINIGIRAVWKTSSGEAI
ncbi:MAG: ATP synthase subunit I [Deltaproteobacteria bacterium]|nr:ATP synthase subunit I [Deltaproteobacteria bacterium]MBW2118099.1 ATP synthase subunit I [Deltaproteobacteria bacterium]MBW2342459.1 ATP synthase subunit I [Deltaproteobacteria bacterium]